MTRARRTIRATRMALAALLAFAAAGCERQVTVSDAGAIDSMMGMGPAQAGGAPPLAGSAAPDAGSPPDRSDAPGAQAPTAVPFADAGAAGEAAGSSVMEGIDQIGESSGAAVDQIQILAVFLSAIELPAVGSAGVSLTQYFGANQAATMYVDWNGLVEFWHVTSRAYYIATAASGDRHLGLVYTQGGYGIHEAAEPREVSGTPATYKEALVANAQGFAWVDYPARAAGQPRMGGGETLGEIVFQSWSDDRRALSDALRYRARLDLSDAHVVFVEYADTTGAVGQIVVQPLDGGEPIAAAPSARHQDRPAIDGDWVVWEEYLGGSDAVIRARNLVSGEVRDLSATTGFRTNPDIRGARVVWEDQRTGNGDIYFTDLDNDVGERVAVSGANHSGATRLSADGIVWIESAEGSIALLRASWVQ
jgi:beta propeller repeat protein